MKAPLKAPELLQSPIIRHQVLCKVGKPALALAFPPFRTSPFAPAARPPVSRFETTQNFDKTLTARWLYSLDPAVIRNVTGQLRFLRLVQERIPKHFTPHKHVPEYRLTYYVEKLECGHERFAFSHDCSAKRRHCGLCARALAVSLPPKKPAVSVSLPADQEKKRA